MPIYEFQCESEKCGHQFEELQKFDDPLPVCPKCGKKKVRKMLSTPALKFVGSGFYVNDYPKEPKPSKDSEK